MPELYPPSLPFDHGMLAAGDGNRVYWEVCGNPAGRPALVIHGGPGSGCTPWHRRLFDPQRYRVVLFDQRGCGRSTPHASDPMVDLSTNTTWALLADIERLRAHLEIDRWLLVGGSWGSTLALAYAERHRAQVFAMVLFGITTGRHSEFDWLFRGGVSRFFPGQWERLRAAAGRSLEDAELVGAYARLLHSPDRATREGAAFEWCLWESATPDWPPKPGLAPRFTDPAFAMAFARLVTHYVGHNAWLEDGVLVRGAAALANVPAVLINGRFDFQSPIGNAHALHRAWPQAELVIVDEAGHAANSDAVTREIVQATDRFASLPEH